MHHLRLYTNISHLNTSTIMDHDIISDDEYDELFEQMLEETNRLHPVGNVEQPIQINRKDLFNDVNEILVGDTIQLEMV